MIEVTDTLLARLTPTERAALVRVQALADQEDRERRQTQAGRNSYEPPPLVVKGPNDADLAKELSDQYKDGSVRMPRIVDHPE